MIVTNITNFEYKLQNDNYSSYKYNQSSSFKNTLINTVLGWVHLLYSCIASSGNVSYNLTDVLTNLPLSLFICLLLVSEVTGTGVAKSIK